MSAVTPRRSNGWCRGCPTIVVYELDRGQERIIVTGVFHGAQDRETWAGLTAGGLTSVLWGVDLQDWKPEVDDDHRLAAALTGVGRGAILLAHDGFAGPEDGAFDGPAPILDRGVLLRRVLHAYAELGLVGRSLGETLAEGHQVREERFPV